MNKWRPFVGDAAADHNPEGPGAGVKFAEDNRTHGAGLTPTSAAAGFAGSPAQAWTATLVVLAVGLVAQLILFSGTAGVIVRVWWGNDAYNHGFFIIPISIFLLWRARHKLVRLAPRPTIWGVGAIAVAAIGWLLGKVAGVLIIEQLSFVLILQAFVLTVVGWRVFRAALFPLLFLLFTVPFGGFLIPPLQDFTAIFVVRALQLSGIPVFLDGLYIQIPAATFEVAAACAGARFLITSVTLGSLVANQFYQQTWRRVLFMALSVLVPIIANGFRAYGLVMIGHLSGMELAVGADHVTFGLVFLSFVMLCLLAVGSLFREKGELFTRAQQREQVSSVAKTTAPRFTTLLVTGVCAVLVAGSAAAYAPVIENKGIQQSVEVELTPPVVGPEWKSVSDTGSRWRPVFHGATDEQLWFYTKGGQTVEIYAAFYPYQRQGLEVVGWRNRVADGKIWQKLTTVDRTKVQLENRPLDVRRIHLRGVGRQRLVLFWYWIDGRFVADPRMAKLYQLKTQLLGGDQSAAVIAVATDYDETPEAAMRLLRSFIAEAPSFRRVIEGASTSGRSGDVDAAPIPCRGGPPCAG